MLQDPPKPWTPDWWLCLRKASFEEDKEMIYQLTSGLGAPPGEKQSRGFDEWWHTTLYIPAETTTPYTEVVRNLCKTSWFEGRNRLCTEWMYALSEFRAIDGKET